MFHYCNTPRRVSKSISTRIKENSLLETMEGSSKLRSSDRHREVECKICLQGMRSNNLKRHMLKHQNLYDLDEDAIHVVRSNEGKK